MKKKSIDLGKVIYIVAFLMFGCSSSGVMGCSGEAGPTIESELLGVYRIDRYQGSQVGCDAVSDIANPFAFLVLYPFRPVDDPDETLLGGIFCADVDTCRADAKQEPEPTLGYSFTTGDDASGWRGWAIQSGGPSNDQCRADVQAHVLTSTSGGTIGIETQTFETVFPPAEMDGTNVTCRNADAIASLNDELECMEIIILEATFEANL